MTDSRSFCSRLPARAIARTVGAGLTGPPAPRVVRRSVPLAVTIMVTSVALLCLGLWLLVRGLKTTATARAAWEARSVPGTAHVVSCIRERYRDPDNGGEVFTLSARYVDTRGVPHTMELSAGQAFPTGHPIEIRFDPHHPATVHLPEAFAESGRPLAFILLGGLLMFLSVAFASR